MRERRLTPGCLPVLAAAVLLCAAPAVAGAQPGGGFTPVTDAMLQSPAPDDWLMWRRTLDGWGYSPLDRIDRENVDQLRMVWSRALTAGRQQGTPPVYDGVMYMPNPRDVIQAIDAVTGDLRWEYRRPRPVDLEQYVAVSTGTTGTTSAQIRLTPELRPSAGNNLFVFALPE